MQGEVMATAQSKKSGKGITDGVISEMAGFWDVMPGHEEELPAATQRMAEAVRSLDPATSMKTGLRDTRHVIFDDGRRLLWATTFETEWDAYVDDAILIIGIDVFLDWLQHTVQGQDIVAWAKSSGADQFARDDPRWQEAMREATGKLKEILQSVQSPASAYFNAVSALTLPQIDRAQRLEKAFQEVLDSPEAEQALQHPALKPLLELAAD
jgi:hypothetical protein